MSHFHTEMIHTITLMSINFLLPYMTYLTKLIYIYIYNEECLFVFMYSDPVGASESKLCIASSFVQGKVEDYFTFRSKMLTSWVLGNLIVGALQ
jgi:hypothetical protein